MSDLNWVGPEEAMKWPKGTLALLRYRVNGEWRYGNITRDYGFANDNFEYLMIERAKETVTVYMYRGVSSGEVHITDAPHHSESLYKLIAKKTITEGEFDE